MRLNVLQEDFSLKVEQSNINAKALNIIIIFTAELKFKTSYLNALLTSNFIIRIRIVEYLYYRAII